MPSPLWHRCLSLAASSQRQGWARFAEVRRAAGAAAGMPRGRGGRALAAEHGKDPPLPEHLQWIVDDYGARRAEEEARRGWFTQLLDSRYAALVGFTTIGSIAFIALSIGDAASGLHAATAWLLRQLGPERARTIFLRAAANGWLPRDLEKDDAYLVMEPREGLRFMTPVGLAAGFDQDAAGVNGFLNMGFGFVEVGPVGGAGVHDAAVLAARISDRLAARDCTTKQFARLGLVGVALGGGCDELSSLAVTLSPHVDYLVLDLDRIPVELHSEKALTELVMDVVGAVSTLLGAGPGVFIKVRVLPAAAGSKSSMHGVATAIGRAALEGGAVGLVLCDGVGSDIGEGETADPLLTKVIGDVYRETDGRLVIIASGGVESGRDALRQIEAGATVVQISSLLLSEGPGACRRIKNELAALMVSSGRAGGSLQDSVGAAHRSCRHRVGTGRPRNPWRKKVAEAT